MPTEPDYISCCKKRIRDNRDKIKTQHNKIYHTIPGLHSLQLRPNHLIGAMLISLALLAFTICKASQ